MDQPQNSGLGAPPAFPAGTSAPQLSPRLPGRGSHHAKRHAVSSRESWHDSRTRTPPPGPPAASQAPSRTPATPRRGPPHLFENGTSDVTVILLLLLSMVTTPPPKFPALPFTLILSCRNCSCKGGTPALSRGRQLPPDQASPARLRQHLGFLSERGKGQKLRHAQGKQGEPPFRRLGAPSLPAPSTANPTAHSDPRVGEVLEPERIGLARQGHGSCLPRGQPAKRRLGPRPPRTPQPQPSASDPYRAQPG